MTSKSKKRLRKKETQYVQLWWVWCCGSITIVDLLFEGSVLHNDHNHDDNDNNLMMMMMMIFRISTRFLRVTRITIMMTMNMFWWWWWWWGWWCWRSRPASRGFCSARCWRRKHRGSRRCYTCRRALIVGRTLFRCLDIIQLSSWFFWPSSSWL